MKNMMMAVLLVISACILVGCNRFAEQEELNNLHGSLQNADFNELEIALNRARAKHASGYLSSNDWARRFTSLASDQENFSSRFDRWVDATHSGYAYLARGIFLQQKAWRARGSKPASETSEVQFATMRSLALRAREDLVAANARIANCALCAGELINNNRAVGDQRSDRQLLETALQQDPEMWSPILAYYQGIYPRWDSYQDIVSFISEMDERLKNPALTANMESRLYYDRARQALSSTRLDNLKIATSWFEKGVTSQPYNGLMVELAEIYAKQGHYLKAAELLEKNLKLNGDFDLDLIEALANAYFAAGQLKKGTRMAARRTELQQHFQYLFAGRR